MRHDMSIMDSPTIKPRRGYVGWQLADCDRNSLKNIFTPAYSRFFGHHCTLQFGVTETVKLPREIDGYVIGKVDHGDGVQALVLMIGGDINRPDGGILHITWSLSDDRKPVDSNAALAVDWEILDNPIHVNLIPKFFPMGS